MSARSFLSFTSALMLFLTGLFPSAQADTFKNPELIETTSDPLAVASADLNGDGILDLVYVDSISPYAVHILLGNGDGTFSHKSDMQLPVGIGDVINLTDVTGDGVVDIVMGGGNSSAGEIAVFRGKGDGTFDSAVISTASHNGSNGGSAFFGWKMGFGDINADGAVDLVAADASSATIYVFLGDNTGKFTLSVTLGPYYFTGLARSYLSDVNGDGHLDIVVNDIVGSQTYVLLGEAGGSFKPATVYSSRALLFTDLNGDGHPDLVGTADPGQVQILQGNSDGTFGAPAIIATVPPTYNLVEAGDFNGDGVPDLLFMGPAGVGVTLGQGNLTYGNLIPSVAGTVTGAFYLNGFTVGSFTGERHNDVAMAVDGGLLVLQSGSDGTFAGADSYDIGTTAGTITVADFNGDKSPDIAITVSANYPRVLLGDGTGTFALVSDQNQTYSTSPPSKSIATADFNGDGKNDLEILGPESYTYQSGQPLVLYGVGSATFSSPVTINTGPAIVGDFNNDGRSDMISFSNGTILVLLGQGNDTFTQVTTPVDYPTFEVAAVGDLNRDGNLDAVTVESGSLRVWLGNGTGSFTQGILISNSSQPFNTHTLSVVVADVDGDGNPDIVAVPYANQGGFPFPLLFYYGNGDGTFQAPVSFPITHAYTQLVVADVNGDKEPDLILSDGSGIAVIENHGNRNFGAEQHFVAGQNISGLSVTDVNGDGFPDIIASNYNGTTVAVLLNEPKGNSVDGASSNGSLTVSPNPVQLGQSTTATLTMSVSSGPVPTGSVSFGVDESFTAAVPLVSGKASFTYTGSLNTGNHTVLATYNGDKTYASESFAALLLVQPPVYPTKTVLLASPLSVSTSQTVSLKATVTGNPTAVPAGNVTFLDGTRTLGVQQIYSNPLLLLDTNLLTVGTHTLTAVYQGWQDPFNEQAIYQPSTSAPVVVTVSSAPTITSLVPSTTTATAGTLITFTANVSAKSAIPFGGTTFYDGTMPLGTSSLQADGSCTFSTASLSPGSHTITATFNANATFAASTSASSTITVSAAAADLIPTAMAIALGENGDQPFLTAYLVAPNSAPAGRITFLNGGSILGQATIDENSTASLQLPVLSTGVHNLFASYSGSAGFAPSVSPALIEEVSSTGNVFALSISSQSVDLSLPRVQPLLLTVAPAEGFRGEIHLSCASGLPAGYECVFSPSTLSNGVSNLRIVSAAEALRHSRIWSVATTVLFSIALMGTIRRKKAQLILIALAIAFISTNGCGSPSSIQRQKQITVVSIQATSGSAASKTVHSAQVIVQF
jgi:hypothetical protein